MVIEMILKSIIGLVIFVAIASPTAGQSYPCGDQVTTDRITGGNLTKIDEFPFMALLRYKKSDTGEKFWGCGGTLIGNRTIITAAHCVEPATNPLNRKELLFVRLGEHDVTKDIDCDGSDCADPPKDFRVRTTIIHPQRNIENRLNDLALLILDTAPQFSDFIRPICIPDPNYTPLEHGYVAGWGSITKNSDSVMLSDVKLAARLKFVNQTTCNRQHSSARNENPINLNQICAGGQNGTNACKGDSGGPLMDVRKNVWYVIGVIQLGPRICGIDNKNTVPTVFAKVSSYNDWIKQNLI